MGTQISVPLVNYLRLIERKESPYYDLVRLLLSDMESDLRNNSHAHGVIYTVNPRRFREKAKDKIQSDKLTTTTITRTLLALLRGSRLRVDDDYYVTTSSGGRKNYHIRVTPNVLSTLQMRL